MTNLEKPLPIKWALLLGIVAAAGYGIGFSTRIGAAAVLIALPCVCLLARVRTARQAFYGGLLFSVGMYVPHLAFFWLIFGPLAILLWVVAGFPLGVFVLLLHLAHRRLGRTWVIWLTPILWTGVEYFRSEVYYLKFAWLLPGQAAAFLPGVRLDAIGVYGLGFFYVLFAAMVVGPRISLRVVGGIALIGLAILMYVPALPTTPPDGALHVAGVQLESADDNQVAAALDKLAIAHPEAQILVLSEYSFMGPVPKVVRDVVRKHERYLVAGGMHLTGSSEFYDTAFVIGPDGHDVFEQAKSVPVQFMGDGLPAAQRRVWDSPWGKIGIAVCYDLSYGSMMDDFIRQGARGLIIPTMDVQHWGEYERRMLHGRMAPIRSAEYGIPTFGVWSSGMSQLTDRYGRVIATAGYPGQGEMIAGPLGLDKPGQISPDRLLARTAMWATEAFIAWLTAQQIKFRRHQQRLNA